MPEDMLKRGDIICKQRAGLGYFGDYCVLASKKCQFHYVALDHIESFALTKSFMFGTVFKKFPLLWREMVTAAFYRHTMEVRRPCNKIKADLIEQINKALRFTNIQPSIVERNPMQDMRQANDDEAKANHLQQQRRNLVKYTELLQELIDKSNTMYSKIRSINKQSVEGLHKLENAVNQSEYLFMDKIDNLVKAKADYITESKKKSII